MTMSQASLPSSTTFEQKSSSTTFERKSKSEKEENK
jgi:hypothetical protein